MKQEYRHTKPIRGKDPTFAKEEIEIWSGLNQVDRDSAARDINRRKRLKMNRKLKKTFK